MSPRIAALDRLVLVIAFLGPLFTIPQIADIWFLGKTEGVSVLSWGAFTIFSVFWLIYARVHRDRVLTVNSALWIVMNGLVAIGALVL